ncbi:thioredoxin family protein [Candidatus Woesearchaeota archaeon]|nr:thioredoxin family protein [Candidatus Woesearchaeota archaeon]
MDRKRISKTKYVAVFATTTLIFIIGMYLGNLISTEKINRLTDIEQEIKTKTMDMELQFLLLSEDPCSISDFTKLSDELYQIGKKLSYMETQLGMDDENVIRLKDYYSLLEIRHWLFFKKVKEQCSRDIDFILYFYSADNCNDCEQQGYILTYLRKNNPSLKVYSFDINLKNFALDTIKGKYDIVKTPSIVINDELYTGFISKDKLETLI